ncbi:hypothetical protein Jann_2716 [Jannaschia sp. CCS1]|nr:hypothetical protein Jann_2716 [Jannaschia sp. CCS1]
MPSREDTGWYTITSRGALGAGDPASWRMWGEAHVQHKAWDHSGHIRKWQSFCHRRHACGHSIQVPHWRSVWIDASPVQKNVATATGINQLGRVFFNANKHQLC